MKIGELSKKVGVSVDTIRYYEKRGLIPKTTRTQAGYRQYYDDAVLRLTFIMQAKELGFTLEEIVQLFAMRSDGSVCEDVRVLAENKANQIQAHIQKLASMQQILTTLAKQCGQTSDIASCPILNVLEDKS